MSLLTSVTSLQANLCDIADASPEMLGEIVGIPKEIILISLVAQEQALYNPKHGHYRNTQHKDSKWLEIADSVGWTETQCKSKWKAMRDQYCRELKRFKFNAKANVKWKYFKELAFLRPYALSRNYRPRHVVNNNNNNSNNNNSFNNSSSNNSLNNSTSTSNENKFTNIKIEAVRFGDCDFATGAAAATAATNNTTTQIKNDTTRLLTPLTDEQLSSVMQQQQTDGNWNYLTATTATPTLTTTATQQQTTTNEDALYCAFVNCVAAVAASGDMQQSTQLQQQPTAATEEEDDDPIHTFLNIESYFEKELIAMVHQEDILYNSFHPNYRNTKLKYEVWDEISRKLKKTVRHCRLKWKALRDQYIREHKRLKNRENVESLPRWKHYDALNFLQKFIKHKTDDFESKHMLQLSKIELDADIERNCDPLHVTPLQSPTQSETVATHELQQQQAQLQLQSLPSLTGPHEQQQFQAQQQQLHAQSTHDDVICVVNVSGNTDTNSAEAGADSGSVSCYDEMDIDTYIIGDGSDEPHDDVDDDNAEDEHEDHKSEQQVPHYNHNSNSNNQRTIENDHDMDFKNIKSITEDSAHTQLAAQQQHVLAVNGGVSPDASLQQQQEEEFLMVTSAESNTATTASFVRNSPLNTLNCPSSCSTSSTTLASTTAIVAVPASDADDEVGAFFAAIAMKIRNAKMSPVAFTDLQIEILRVINGSLRHQ